MAGPGPLASQPDLEWLGVAMASFWIFHLRMDCGGWFPVGHLHDRLPMYNGDGFDSRLSAHNGPARTVKRRAVETYSGFAFRITLYVM
jgi:hypothetical protein